VLLGARAAGAQVGNLGSLTGLVRDASGALVPDARIVLTQVDTDVRQEVTTTGGGRYQFARIPPGRYRIEVTKTGFQTATVPEVVVTVNEAARADVELSVGPASDTTTVGATVNVLQTQSSENSTLVSGRDIRELPLNGRDFSRLIRLAPGVGGFAGLPTPSISGARNSFNTYAIDGLGNNDERSSDGLASSGGAASFDRTGAPNVISTEAIQEFRIITSNADATFGRSSGGQISIVTKSGTSEYHGSGYGYWRDDALDARNFFNSGPFFNGKGEAIVPPFSQQLYGGTLGGPIQRGRQFFFASYEGFRQRLQQTGSYVAPNADLIGLMPRDLQRLFQTFFVDRGVLSSTSSPGQFSPLTIADRQAALAAGFPAALFDGNAANGEAGTLLLSTASTRDIDQQAFLVRTDHVLTNNLRASGRFGYARPTQTSANGLPIDLQRDQRRWMSAVGELVTVLTPRQILEVRGGVMRPTFSQGPAGGMDSRFTNIGVPEGLGVSVVATGSGLSSVGLLGTNGFLDNQIVPQLQAQHTWTRGAWMLRSGADLSFQHIDIHNGTGRPTYSFQGFIGPRGLLGAAPGQESAIANSASASIFGANGGPTTALRTFETSRQELFAQADWQARPDLTVNLGMRYSYFGVYDEVNHAVGNLYATDTAGNIVADVSPFQSGRTANVVAAISDDLPLYRRDRNNFEPRAGIAWNLGAKGRTVLRGSYGLYHDRLFQLVLSAQGGLVNNPPFTIASNASAVPFVLGGALPVVSGIPTVTGIDPTIENPSTHRVTAGIEQNIGGRTTVAATYVGSFARQLFGVAEVNGGSALPQALRPDARFSVQRQIGNTSSSDYHALQVVVNRRVSHGLMVNASYTLADSKDDSSAETFAVFPGFTNTRATSAAGYSAVEFVERPRSADWGYSDFYSRHALSVGWLVEMPFGSGRRWGNGGGTLLNALAGGWSLSGIVIARSGAPLNLLLGSDANKDGNTGDRPALLSGSLEDLYVSGGADKTQYLVPAAEAATRLGAPANPADPFAVVPRNALFGPNYVNFDLSLMKQFRVARAAQVRVELNAFNVFNHTQLGAPVTSVSDARFGRIVSTADGSTPRQLQLGLKFLF
jgi:hypothetical protein